MAVSRIRQKFVVSCTSDTSADKGKMDEIFGKSYFIYIYKTKLRRLLNYLLITEPSFAISACFPQGGFV